MYVTLHTHACLTTHSCMCHDSLIYVSWLTHTYVVTQSYMCHGTLLYMSRHTNIRVVTHLYIRRHDLIKYVSRHTHVYMTLSYMCHGTLMNMSRNMSRHICVMSHWYVCHDPLILVSCQVTHILVCTYINICVEGDGWFRPHHAGSKGSKPGSTRGAIPLSSHFDAGGDPKWDCTRLLALPWVLYCSKRGGTLVETRFFLADFSCLPLTFESY